MASKGKKAEDLFTQHFSEQQHASLPNTIWDFLLSEAGDRENIHRLKPKQIKDYAGDFLDSADGHFYWPLSAFGLWQYEGFTYVETKKYIAEIMSKERLRRETKDALFLVDMDPPSSSKKKSSPNKGKSSFLGPGSSTSPPALSGEAPQSSSTARSPIKTPATPTRREKSPTIAPDRPYKDAPERSISKPRKSIRPTPTSILIAAGKPHCTTAASHDTTTRDQSWATTVASDKTQSSSSSRKRPAEEDVEDGRSNPPALSPTERASKRVALDPSPSFSSLKQPPFFEPAEQSSAAPATPRSMLLPSELDQGRSPAPKKPSPSPSNPELVPAYGVQFSVDNLAKIPETLLEYLTECRDHYIRLANSTPGPRRKDDYRSRSTLFQNLHADLESRIKYLAHDAEEKQRVESSHCLWNA